MKIFIFGHGYIGTRCANAWGGEAVLSDRRIESVQDAMDEIRRVEPDVVLNAAGVKGKPNVDWCEDHPVETMRGNVVMPLLLADACRQTGKYLLHIGSGCIYYGDSPHQDKAWREDDFGNPSATYSRGKWAADLVLSTLPNTAIARIRMPLDWQKHPGNLIDKLASYKKVIDVENSVTVVDDLVNVLHQLMEKRAPGIFHVTNPGTIRHREILDLYRELVDPTHVCEWIQEADLVAQGLAKKNRSNNFLASENLEKVGIRMRPVKEAVHDTLAKYQGCEKS